MQSLSARFAGEMTQAANLVQLILSIRDLTKLDLTHFRSRHPVAATTRCLHRDGLAFSSTPIAYDGIYLAICGRFELTVRELMERFVESLMADVPAHKHLPEAIREWHAKGCASLILHLGEERFKHLTVNALIGNLASCLDSSKSGAYKLTPEAYSYNERNFRANEIDNVLTERLGLKKIWQKLARRPKLVSWSGASHPDTETSLGRRTLDTCISRRNAIIHRGRSYYTPGPSEVIECAKFFAILIECAAEVMTDYKA